MTYSVRLTISVSTLAILCLLLWGCSDDESQDCEPLTCESLQAECGTFADQCGGTLECGPCNGGDQDAGVQDADTDPDTDPTEPDVEDDAGDDTGTDAGSGDVDVGQNGDADTGDADADAGADDEDAAGGDAGEDPDETYPNRPPGMTTIGSTDGSVLEEDGEAFGISGFGSWWEFSACGDPNAELIDDPTNPTGSGKSIELTINPSGCGAIATAMELGGAAWDELYILVRLYLESPNWDNGGSGNKWFYINTVGQSGVSHFYTGRPNNTIPNQLRLVGNSAHPDGGVQLEAHDAHVQDEWITFEFHFVAESEGAAGDGEAYVWRNHSLADESTSVPWGHEGDDPRLAIMQWYAHFSPSGGGEREGPASYRIGELYIAGK